MLNLRLIKLFVIPSKGWDLFIDYMTNVPPKIMHDSVLGIHFGWNRREEKRRMM